MVCKNVRDASTPLPELPDDIVTEILSYLPAKSVGRFRCVSRSWRAALSSPSFVELHLRRANRPGHPKLLCCPSMGEWCLSSWQRDGNPAVKKLMRNKFPEDTRPGPVTKPLRGLVLISSFPDGGYFVCNPSTGQVLALPDTRVPLKKTYRHPKPSQSLLPCYLHVSYGLGYCTANNEYKVMRLFSGLVNEETSPDCEVFVLGAPAYWRPTAQKPPPCVVVEETPGLFLDGSLHFQNYGGDTIVTFNVRDETFGSKPLPPPVEATISGDTLYEMTELDGCLCIMHANPGYDSPVHIWLLRDYEAGCWEELCCINPTCWPEDVGTLMHSNWTAPICMYSGNDDGREKIMMGTRTGKVFVVHPSGGAPEVLFQSEEGIAGEYDDSYLPTIGLYEESLVPVGRTVEEMVFSSPMSRAWSQVLKWLPSRSVSELSLVCREWRAIVTTDRFIQSHVIHPKLIDRSPLIKFVMDPVMGTYGGMDETIQRGKSNISLPILCSQPCHGLNVGSFPGMPQSDPMNYYGRLSIDDEQDFARYTDAFPGHDFLCNPATGYHQNISLDDNIGHMENGKLFAGRVALGYDADRNDHVLVRLAYTKKNLETRDYELRCSMCFVKGGIHFKALAPPPRPVASVMPAYSNGKIYWLVDTRLGPAAPMLTCELVVFDIAARRFEVVQGPPCSAHGRVSVLELYGTLCVACSDQDANKISVWAMTGNGNAWSMEYHLEFAKFSPEYSSERATLMGVDPADGHIWINTDRSLGHYDPKTGALETVIRHPRGNKRFWLIIYQESLFYLRRQLEIVYL